MQAAKWFSLDSIGADGKEVHAQLKVWVGDGQDPDMWDGVIALDNPFAGQKLGKIVNNSFSNWRRLWDLLGIAVENRFIPSILQFNYMKRLDALLQALHPAFEADVNRLKDVHQFSTAALLAIMIDFASTGKGNMKSKSKGVILCMLDAFCINPDFYARVDPSLIPARIADEHICDEVGVTGFVCSHIRSATANCTALPASVMRNTVLLEMVLKLHSFAFDCTCCAKFLKVVIDACSDFIHDSLADSAPHDPSKAALPRNKRRRDSDVREYLMNSMVVQGKASSSAAAVRSEYGPYGTKLARQWLITS